MEPNSSAPHGVSPSCLKDGAPKPNSSGVGEACTGRKVHCGVGCAAQPTHSSLALFWKDWQRLHQSAAKLEALKIGPPYGPGG